MCEKETKIDAMCCFDEAWRGKCKELAVKNGRCEKHADLVCISCGAPATHTCSETGQFVCGAPLCDDCEHTTAENGTNGGIGFYRVSDLPKGIRTVQENLQKIRNI